MKFKLVALIPLVALPLLACASGDSTVQRDTADFFTRQSQGYRIEVKEQAPLDVMWTFSARENEFQRFADLDGNGQSGNPPRLLDTVHPSEFRTRVRLYVR